MKETSSSTAGETRHLNMDRTRVLILRPDNIGDVLLFTGALRHIRNLYPEAHITLAVQAHIVNLVELCPHIDACVPVDELTWRGKVVHKGFPVKRKWNAPSPLPTSSGISFTGPSTSLFIPSSPRKSLI
jgi:hypothetical protein